MSKDSNNFQQQLVEYVKRRRETLLSSSSLSLSSGSSSSLAGRPRSISESVGPSSQLSLLTDEFKVLLLQIELANCLRILMPPLTRLCMNWRLCYASERDGFSLKTFYGNCAKEANPRSQFLLVIQAEEQKEIFGAFLTSQPAPHWHHYGTGEVFLWKEIRAGYSNEHESKMSSLNEAEQKVISVNERESKVSSLNEAEQKVSFLNEAEQKVSSVNERQISFSSSFNQHQSTSLNSVNERQNTYLRSFFATGKNEYWMISEPGFFAVGCSNGAFGLWLDESLRKGNSKSVATFDNEPLVNVAKGEDFTCKVIELWIIDH
jgi:hypothetical protein